MKYIIGVLASLFITIIEPAGYYVADLPNDVANDRFATEYFSVIRPGLSLNGFDNGGNDSKGLGLKQVLNEALSGDVYIKNKLTQIFSQSPLSLNTNLSAISDEDEKNNQIERNSRILQYTAFEALASYVLEHNGIDSVDSKNAGLNIRSHAVAVADLKQKLLFVSSNYYYAFNNTLLVTNMVTDRSDYVKNVKSYQNIGRAIDLYLALENAYKEWDYNEWNDNNSTILLSFWEKQALNLTAQIAASKMRQRLYSSVALISFGVQEYEVEPGNRPLKGFISAGYLALAIQNPFSETSPIVYDANLGEGASDFFNPSVVTTPVNHFTAARDVASSPATNNNRTKYWMYQSSDGGRQWAEGPYYFDYALADAIPFWHAVRINGLLGGVSDPFKGSNKWFLNPVEWLADVSTPDGFTPPIDDGNKFRMRVTDLLRWSNTYGDATVGGKFATIHNNTLKYHGTPGQTFPYNNYQYLIDIAIPKRSTSATVALPNLTSNSEQQYIQRYTDAAGNEHYFLFNKEYGTAITRGEGHEQPDQMQLLYYINGNSYLVDGGYDTATPQNNSFLNGYLYHNVMHYSEGSRTWTQGFITKHNEGGLQSPYVSLSPARKKSEHNEVLYPGFSNISANVKVMKGQIELKTASNNKRAKLNRRVVLVLDEAPFLIDFNRIEELNQSTAVTFKMHYFGNSSLLYNQTDMHDWSYWDISNDTIPGTTGAMNLYISAVSEDPVREDRAYSSSDCRLPQKLDRLKVEYSV